MREWVGGVRVHEGPSARDVNDRIQATAFTGGNDVFFRDGVPDVSSPGERVGGGTQMHAVRTRDHVEAP